MRLPNWLKVQYTGTHEIKKILRHYTVSSVCEEARCPNQGFCFAHNTVTFLILGDYCTRNCRFCGVAQNSPLPPDAGEPERIADAVLALGITFVVLTSVTRDDLPDGGAGHFAETIRSVRRKRPDAKIEVLTPDFNGNPDALKAVLAEKPDVFNHNVETVPRLFPRVRPMADYNTSLNILTFAKNYSPYVKIKSGFMLGIGEHNSEVLKVMDDLRQTGCDLLTIGQYLRPRKENIPVVEYKRPEVFVWYRSKGLEMGFEAVSASPLTRSSMNAEEIYRTTNRNTS